MNTKKIKHALYCCETDQCEICAYREYMLCFNTLSHDACTAIEEQEERIAIMQESMEALEKRNEPIKPDSIMTTSAGISMAHCPNCNEQINQYRHPKFCGACGQAVKWE